MTREAVAEVRQAVDLDKLTHRWELLEAKEARTLGEIRLEKGKLLKEARAAFPRTGNDGGWSKWLAKWKISPQTARDYMKLAGYVESTSTTSVEVESRAIPTYAAAGIDKRQRAAHPPLALVSAPVETIAVETEADWEAVPSKKLKQILQALSEAEKAAKALVSLVVDCNALLDSSDIEISGIALMASTFSVAGGAATTLSDRLRAAGKVYNGTRSSLRK